MKLMLTSNGLSNESLRSALKKIVNGEIKIAFIPTAANSIDDEKGWLINDLVNCDKVGRVDIVDISALDKKIWLSRLKKANVIFMGGGDTVYLMKQIKKSGLINELPELLKGRVYVGISAGSTITGKDLATSSKFLFTEDLSKVEKGLGLVEFYIRAHLNSLEFPKVRDEYLKEYFGRLNRDVYALDDDSAIVFDNGKIEVVSEGKWIKYPA